MSHWIVHVTFLLGLLVIPMTHAQCDSPARDAFETDDADVIIGVMQDVLSMSSDGMTCVGPVGDDDVLYEAAKVAVRNLPSGMAMPNFKIGLERYESCGFADRAVEDATYYVSRALERDNATSSELMDTPCLSAPYRPGLIGPYSSGEALAVSPVLGNFGMPLVSHAATNPSLSDKDTYGTFLRTIPPDNTQAMVMRDLLQDFGWTYVHLVHGAGSYGKGGAEALLEAAKGRIAFASVIGIPKEGADYDNIVSQLVANNNAKAVVLWMSPSQTASLLSAVQMAGGAAGDLQFVGSDYVAEIIDGDLLTASYRDAARGLITIVQGESNNADFQTYLSANGLASTTNPYITAIVDATHVYVDSLTRAHSDLCGSSTMGVCEAMKKLETGDFLAQYVKTSDFIGETGRRVAFDMNGDPIAPTYEIRQFVSDGPNNWISAKVGQWTGNGSLNVMRNLLEFYTSGDTVSNQPPTSACSSGDCPVFFGHYDTVHIAGLFPVHKYDCSVFNSQYSDVPHAQAMLWAMDRINKDSSILPGIQLSPLLGDTCYDPTKAAAATYDVIQRFPRQAGRALLQDERNTTLAGVISRVTDDETLEVEGILEPLGIHHISDSARLAVLSDKREYPYFSRMVSPNCGMVDALIDFLLEHDLTYVQVTQTGYGIYNETAAKFTAQAKERGICIAQSLTFEPTTSYDDVVDRLLAKPAADVIVNFANYNESPILLRALERRELPGEFLQVIYVFNEDMNKFQSYNRDAHVDSITLSRATSPVEEFTNFFIGLTPEGVMQNGLFVDEVHNTWFAEYWMNKFRCQLPYPGLPQVYMTMCSGTEAIEKSSVESTEGIINAVYVYAHALSALHRDVCSTPGVCSAMLDTSPQDLAGYVRSVRFMSQSGSMAQVSFDEYGDAPATYSLNALASDYSYYQIASYSQDAGFATVDQDFAIGAGKESQCVGACYECVGPRERGATYMRIPGDFDIPAVLWLSEEGTGANLTCGATRFEETMAIEIIKFALEQINNSTVILPDINLGLTIVDSCGQFLVTARQLTAIMGSTAPDLPATGPMLGVLGPVREYLQGHVASDVTSPFYIPTIGFTPASPSVFSDEGPYPASSLLSTAPSYDNEARAVVDVLKHMGWHHVIFVYSHSYYGHAGNQSFNAAVGQYGICVRDSIGIDLDSPPSVHGDIVRTIKDSGITVVVAFVESTDARLLLQAEKTYSETTGSTGKTTWIGSDKWFTDPKVDITSGLEDIARGAIVVTNYIVDLDPLKAYLSNLDLPMETDRNPWLRDYVTNELTGGCMTYDCIAGVDLGRHGTLPAYTATLINAVHVLAQATHNKIQLLCGNTDYIGHTYKRSDYHSRPSNRSVPLCAEFYEASYHDILYAVRDVYVFEGAGGRPFWFENRQGPAEYTIINFQGDSSTGRFVPIGEWVSGELVVHKEQMYLYNPAAEQQIEAPTECPTASPSACPSTGAYPPAKWVWDTDMEAWSIVVVIVTAIGGFFSAASILVFIVRRNSSVVKRSGTFLMCMLSLGVILMYLNNVWYMVAPSESACGVQRWMTSFSYAVVYASLISKVISSTILSGQEGTNKPAIGGQMCHIVLFCVFLGAEVILVGEWLILDRPAAVGVYATNQAGCHVHSRYVCNHDNSSIVVSMIYVYVLVLATFVLSYFGSSSRTARDASRKDTKYHLLTSLLSICFLVAWACCYTLLPQENFRTPAILIGITVDATCIFLLAIVPKMLAFYRGEEEPEDAYGVGDMSQGKIGFENKGADLPEYSEQTPI